MSGCYRPPGAGPRIGHTESGRMVAMIRRRTGQVTDSSTAGIVHSARGVRWPRCGAHSYG